MKVLLRNTNSGLFYKNAHEWTSSPTDAHNFRISLHAVQIAQNQQLAQAELVYDFGDERPCIVMPIFTSPEPPHSATDTPRRSR